MIHASSGMQFSFPPKYLHALYFQNILSLHCCPALVEYAKKKMPLFFSIFLLAVKHSPLSGKCSLNFAPLQLCFSNKVSFQWELMLTSVYIFSSWACNSMLETSTCQRNTFKCLPCQGDRSRNCSGFACLWPIGFIKSKAGRTTANMRPSQRSVMPVIHYIKQGSFAEECPLANCPILSHTLAAGVCHVLCLQQWEVGNQTGSRRGVTAVLLALVQKGKGRSRKEGIGY